MNMSRIIDSVLLTILLIGVSTFPVNLLVNDLFWYYFIEALLMLAVFLFILFYENRHPETNPPEKRFNLFNFLLLLPSVLIAFSNIFYALIMRAPMVGEPKNWFKLYDLPHLVFIVLNVIVEEYIFRKHLLGNLTHPKKIIRILISAGIFAACHLTLFFSTFDPSTLIVVAYAFGLGMILGLVYCYAHSLIACIGLHLLFNLFNDFLFEHIFVVNSALWYYLINVFVALIVGVYLLIIYLAELRKSPAELDLN